MKCSCWFLIVENLLLQRFMCGLHRFSIQTQGQCVVFWHCIGVFLQQIIKDGRNWELAPCLRQRNWNGHGKLPWYSSLISFLADLYSDHELLIRTLLINLTNQLSDNTTCCYAHLSYLSRSWICYIVMSWKFWKYVLPILSRNEKSAVKNEMISKHSSPR